MRLRIENQDAELRASLLPFGDIELTILGSQGGYREIELKPAEAKTLRDWLNEHIDKDGGSV